MFLAVRKNVRRTGRNSHLLRKVPPLLSRPGSRYIGANEEIPVSPPSIRSDLRGRYDHAANPPHRGRHHGRRQRRASQIATGQGSDQVGGKPLLTRVIAAATSVVPPADVFVIIGHEAERVRSVVTHTGVNFVLQTDQRGTGHAPWSRSQHSASDHVIRSSGDAPQITPKPSPACSTSTSTSGPL